MISGFCLGFRVPVGAGDHAALWVEEPDGAAVALVASEEALEGMMGGLNRRGLRERALLVALRKRRKALARAAPPKLTPDIAAVPGCGALPDASRLLMPLHAVLLRKHVHEMSTIHTWYSMCC